MTAAEALEREPDQVRGDEDDQVRSGEADLVRNDVGCWCRAASPTSARRQTHAMALPPKPSEVPQESLWG